MRKEVDALSSVQMEFLERRTALSRKSGCKIYSKYIKKGKTL